MESTQDLYDAVTARAPEMDVVIQAAAPADYRFATTYTEKHKKAHDSQSFVIELVENPDIAAAVGAAKNVNAPLHFMNLSTALHRSSMALSSPAATASTMQ